MNRYSVGWALVPTMAAATVGTSAHPTQKEGKHEWNNSN